MLGNKLYVVAGGYMPGITESSVVKVYLPANDIWVDSPWVPTARSYLAATSVNGVLYAVGGQLFTNVLATNERYTP